MKNKSHANILIANGVNLDLLGRREPDIYGVFTLQDLENFLQEKSSSAAHLYSVSKVSLSFFQSNDEADFIAEISKTWDGIVINAGAWTHTSVALGDRLKALKIPFVEVHISNLSSREPFRQKSYLAPHAVGVVWGFGKDSYLVGLIGLLNFLGNP